MTYAAVQMKASRIEIRVTEELLARVDARAEELGQTRTKFVERALEAALAGVVVDSVSSRSAPPSAKKTAVALEVREAVAEHREGRPLGFEEPRLPSKPVPGVRRGSSVESDAMVRQRKLNEARAKKAGS